MAVPASREQLKDWCLRQLGHPVLEINIDDDQLEDSLDNALQYFQDFHFDGVEKWYTKHQITAQNITDQYIPITENIIGVTKIFSPGSRSGSSTNIFDLNYQMHLQSLIDFTSTTMANYVITRQHMAMIDLLLNGENSIRFNRHTDKLYIDWDWAVDAVVDQYIIIEGYIIIDPETYTDVYNDRMLKQLATSYIKKQWGTNMKKFQGMQLPGGIVMNGQAIFDEAVKEIADLEDTIRKTYEEPPAFILA